MRLKNKAIISSILILTFISLVIVNNIWYDTHWGGDAGDESYTIPVVPVPEPEPEPEPRGICSAFIIPVSIVPITYFIKRRPKNE